MACINLLPVTIVIWAGVVLAVAMAATMVTCLIGVMKDNLK